MGAHTQNADKMVALSLTLPWRIVKKLGDHCSSLSTGSWDLLGDHFCILILYEYRLGLPEWFSHVCKHVHQVTVGQKWQKASHIIPYPRPVSVVTNYITPMVNLPSLSLQGTSIGWEQCLRGGGPLLHGRRNHVCRGESLLQGGTAPAECVCGGRPCL